MREQVRRDSARNAESQIFGIVEMAQHELAATTGAEEINEQSGIDELQPGTVLLHGQYTITNFINNGGFGITYLAKDSLDRKVVIKECFPGAFCRRTNTIVSARSRAHQGELKSIIRLFVQEARSLSKLVHPNIVGVHQVFEDNETAYMAIDFIDGKDLLDVVEDGTIKLEPNEIVSITRKMLEAIGFVHQHGVLHRDISPDNILLTKDREPILIDFGAAREHASNTNRALSALRVVKDGYSPQEFYIAGSEQGPWSDLYALAASLYHVIKGVAPINGQARLAALAENRPDPYEPLTGHYKGYPRNFLEAIDKAMKTLPKERLQTAEEWVAMIDNTPIKAAVDGNPEIAISRILEEEAKHQAQIDRETIDARKQAEEEELKAQAAALVSEQEEEDHEPEPDEDDLHDVFADDDMPVRKSSSKVGLLAAGSVLAIIAVAGYVVLAPSAGSDDVVTVDAPAAAAATVAGQDETTEIATSTPVDIAPAQDAVETESTDVTAPVETGEIVDPVTETAEPAIPPATDAVIAETTETETVADIAAVDAFASVAEPADIAPVTETETQADAPAQDIASIATEDTSTDIAEEITAPAQPETAAEETTPAAPVELADQQIAFSHWDVQMPFRVSHRRLGGANAALVTRLSDDINTSVTGDWLKEGALIYTINGDPIDARQSLAVQILNDLKVDPDGFTRVAVRFKPDLTSRFERGLLAVPVVRQIGLPDGTMIEVRNVGTHWQTSVVSVATNGNSPLRTGDVLVAERHTNTPLTSPEALDTALQALVASGTATADFHIERNGGSGSAELALKTK